MYIKNALINVWFILHAIIVYKNDEESVTYMHSYSVVELSELSLLKKRSL